MDAEHRNVIKNNSEILAKLVNVDKLKPLLLDFKIFTTSMLKDIITEHDLFRELPTRGPDAFDCFIKVLKKAGYEIAVDILKNSEKPSEQEFYVMTSKPLGFCLIINNVDFKELGHRYGSDRDANALDEILSKIGYSVEREKNLKAKDLMGRLETFSKKDFLNVDSCIVIILSHGKNINNLDVIFGTDKKPVYKTEIYKLFSNENCKSLMYKPKIFFFQACRGNDRDYGVDSKEHEREKQCNNNVISTVSFDASGIHDVPASVLPTFSDMYIVHSSLPHQVSHRDHQDGTWFCQDLVNVLSEDYKKKDLDTMMKKVNKKVMSRLSAEYRTKQALHVENYGLSKSIRFYRKPK